MEKEILTEEQKIYIEAHAGELEDLVLRLARIPAPTGREERRAQFCLKWLQQNGAGEAYIDQVGNVVYEYAPDGLGLKNSDIKEDLCWKDSARVFMAHMDVVFPDMEELPLEEKDGFIYGPGICDNTANLAVLLMTAKYVAQHRPQTGGERLIFVCDVGEEGLGNLKGVREICRSLSTEEEIAEADKCQANQKANRAEEDKGQANQEANRTEDDTCRATKEAGCARTLKTGRIEAFYAFDLTYDSYTSRAVGSLRYRIQIKTKGGHSYGDFGSTNAIAVLSELIHDLYQIEVPRRGKTTYNVGMITGGTSVNTIAQEAQMLYEIRSDHVQDLEEMRERFEETVERCRRKYGAEGIFHDRRKDETAEACSGKGAELLIELLGERPCERDVDEKKRQQLFAQVEGVVEQVTGRRPLPVPCSTDCNIPLSMGIPSVCVGMCRGAGFHTREEYLEKASLKDGFAVGLALVLGQQPE